MTRALIVPLLALLTACGGGPNPRPLSPPAGAIAWTEVVGGAYVDTCRTADGFAATRAGSVERWATAESGPPRRLWRHALPWPTSGAPATHISCPADAPVVHLADGQARAATAEGLSPAALPPRGDAPQAQRSFPAGARTVQLGRGGWALRQGRRAVEARPVAGDLADATWDGETLWAVGAGGLFRWRPGDVQPLRLRLPAVAGERELMRVFRDGPFLWVIDTTGIGWPLRIDGATTTLARPAGPVRLTGPERVLIIGHTRIRLALGQSTMQLAPAGDEDGARATELSLDGRITAVQPLGDRELLLGVGDAIERWRIDGPPTQVSRWAAGAPTTRIIADAARVLAVGGYGVLVGRVDGPVNAPAARPAAGPADPPGPGPAPSLAPR